MNGEAQTELAMMVGRRVRCLREHPDDKQGCPSIGDFGTICGLMEGHLIIVWDHVEGERQHPGSGLGDFLELVDDELLGVS